MQSDLFPGDTSQDHYNDLNIFQGYRRNLRNAHIQGMSFSTMTLMVLNAASIDFVHIGKHYRQETTISMLSDDVLLEILDLFQKNYDPAPRPEALPESVWDWHILVHVCQKWRQVVFASPLRLHLRILCMHGTPVRKSLDIWPTLPVVLEYVPQIEGADEDNLISALEHPDRVSSIGLWLTALQLGKIVKVMQEPFPALTHLFLSIHISSDVPVLPCEFLGRSAPCLRTIKLYGVPFPGLPVLLLSTSDLVNLRLFDIPQTGYIPPEAMVAALAMLTKLEDLRIGFQSPASRPDRIHLPPTTRTVLPALTMFEFHGVPEYLEDFVAQIDAPRLHGISVSCFNQLVDIEIPQLWQFIDHSENLGQAMRCFVEFQHNYISFRAGLTTPAPEPFYYFPHNIKVRILCEGIDWQAAHMAQALNQISATRVLSNMVHVVIHSDEIGLKPEDMDDIEWRDLLRPFSSVQTLFVSREFAGHVSHSLNDTPVVMVTELFPALEMLCLEGQPVSSVHKFITARSESGLPVTTVDSRREFEERLLSYLNQNIQ
jgi:hypothetical protein